jgi:hypothetical protein
MPLGYRVQERIPIVRNLAARIFGLGAWPVRLNAASRRGPVKLSPPSFGSADGWSPAGQCYYAPGASLVKGESPCTCV